MGTMSELHAEQDMRQQERAAAIGECREAFLHLISEAMYFDEDTDANSDGTVTSVISFQLDAYALKDFMTDIGIVTAYDEHPYDALKRLVG